MALSAQVSNHGHPATGALTCSKGGAMAKRHGRPSRQYRYEHYDPWM